MMEVLFSPAEFEALDKRDLSGVVCVVFDVLRATSSIITALAHGAAAVIPVRSIEEALEAKNQDKDVLLAGEREGFRITSRVTGGIGFDLGNSPREFQSPSVAGRTIVMTTTNGTRALHACRGAREILPASLLNVSRVAEYVAGADALLLVCSGTHEEAAYEDVLGAGALADLVWSRFASRHIADSAQIARNIFRAAQQDLAGSMQYARNGRRLLQIGELRDDVSFCLQRDVYSILARMEVNGRITRVG